MSKILISSFIAITILLNINSSYVPMDKNNTIYTDVGSDTIIETDNEIGNDNYILVNLSEQKIIPFIQKRNVNKPPRIMGYDGENILYCLYLDDSKEVITYNTIDNTTLLVGYIPLPSVSTGIYSYNKDDNNLYFAYDQDNKTSFNYINSKNQSKETVETFKADRGLSSIFYLNPNKTVVHSVGLSADMLKVLYNVYVHNSLDNSFKCILSFSRQINPPYNGDEISRMNCYDNNMYLYTISCENEKRQDYISVYDENGNFIRKINMENIDLLIDEGTDNQGRVHYIRVLNDYIVVGILGCSKSIGIYDTNGNLIKIFDNGKYYCCENLLDNKPKYIPIRDYNKVHLFDCQSQKTSTLEFGEEIDDALCYYNKLLVTFKNSKVPECYAINVEN